MDSGELCAMIALDQMMHVWLVGSWDSQDTLTMAVYLLAAVAGIYTTCKCGASCMLDIFG